MGQRITTIWIASHAGCLKRLGCDVKLFDCTFYKNWTDLEIELNTKNKQFKKSDILKNKGNNNDNFDLKNLIDNFKPDIIFILQFPLISRRRRVYKYSIYL